MKILVLAENYLKDSNYAMLYVHTRNVQYINNGIDVEVINFREKTFYAIDSINVYGVNYFMEHKDVSDYDLVISHAPNIKNHFKFIFKNLSKIKNLVFFIHGHEVLLKDKHYPKPYKFQKNRIFNNFAHFVYDRLKVRLFKYFTNYLIKKDKNIKFVFVSKWMEDQFFTSTNLSRIKLSQKTQIIHNPVNQTFLENAYVPSENYEGDFITIRPFDGPKYCIDLLCEIARVNPSSTFTLYGDGDYFKYNKTPNNLKVHNKFLLHNEIPEILNNHKAALMLTRLDAQGVMVCEMACYGIPVVTSDISLKRDLLGTAKNVSFLKNDLSQSLTSLNIQTGDNSQIKLKFSDKETLQKEISLFKDIINTL